MTKSQSRGTVVERPTGRWQAQVSLGTNPRTGTRLRLSKTFDTKKQAQEWKTKQLYQADQGQVNADVDSMILGAWLDEWLKRQQARVDIGELRQSTFESYQLCVERYLKPWLGSVRVRNLTIGMVERWRLDLATKGGRDDRPLSGRSVAKANQAGLRALKDARLARANPFEVHERRKKSPTRRKVVWNQDQVQQFLAHVAECNESGGTRLFSLWRLTAATGARRGEIHGLTWQHIDLLVGTVTIERQLQQRGQELRLIEDTKTVSSRRTVELDDTTVEALRSYRKLAMEERLAAGSSWVEDSGFGDLVFRNPDGTAVKPEATSQRFKRHARHCGLPVTNLHTLRDASASMLLSAGEPVLDVSHRLGHANPVITHSRYSHSIQEGAARRVGQAAGALLDEVVVSPTARTHN